MLEPRREYSPSTSLGLYRYGFNGKENDNEVKGEGNQQDYGMRIYDPRLGRFLSVDPIGKDYPELAPYQFASNSPIAAVDLNGGEILPINSSIYRQKYRQGMTIAGKVYDNYDVEIVYNNIPGALKNPSTKSLKFTSGGPVTAFGRDYDPAKDGKIIYATGRYYNNGPDFYGDEEDLDITKSSHSPSPPPSSSTQGLYSFEPDAPNNKSTEANESASENESAKGSALQESYGIISNLTSSKAIWKAGIKEGADRNAFYQATNIIDDYSKRDALGYKEFNNGAGRADLINFVTDGTLPNDESEIQTRTLGQLEYQLKIIFTGIQILYQKDLPYQKSLNQKISDINAAYKNAGGKLNFDKIYEYHRPKRN